MLTGIPKPPPLIMRFRRSGKIVEQFMIPVTAEHGFCSLTNVAVVCGEDR
jgi:hypothetical protein